MPDVAPVPGIEKREGPVTLPDATAESNYQFPRRLILCLDGTWNKRDSGTNVYHLSNLVLEGKIKPTPPRTDTWIQMIYYDEGVGTGLLDHATGGAFGIGLSGNVREAYDWLVERYRDGDEVYIFGFSRGAFTARSLVGMIAGCGLLHRGAPLPPAQLWARYRQLGAQWSARSSAREVKKWLQFGRKQEAIRELKDFKSAPWDKRNGAEIARPKTETEELLCTWSRRIPIKCLAVFDTVGSMGVEALAIPWLRENRAQFHNTHLTSIINNGFHALAIDEYRANFNHIPWRRPTTYDLQQNQPEGGWGVIKQRWFIGAHSNIGGGYYDDTLAQLPLQWFIDECEELGLRFKPRMGAPDIRDVTKLEDCLPLIAGKNQKDARTRRVSHVCDSFSEFAGGMWRYVIRSKRNYREIDPLPEFESGREVRSLNEELDPSVTKLVCLHRQKMRPKETYNPPNLYEYLKRHNLLGETAINGIPLPEPPHHYFDGWRSVVGLIGWIIALGFAGALIARLTHDGYLYWLVCLVPALALLADWRESVVTHYLALEPRAMNAERREGRLDFLLDVRLFAIGLVLLGTGYAIFLLVATLWILTPVSELVWLAVFALLLVHFGASMAWADLPMREAGFGTITKLQRACTPQEVTVCLRSWTKGPGKPDPNRLRAVQRCLWRDIVAFIPAYGITLFFGAWMACSLYLRLFSPDDFGSPCLGLLSLRPDCWVFAVCIAGITALADYIEDTFHLCYVRHYITNFGEASASPSALAVRVSRAATLVKTGIFCVGIIGVLLAIVGLAWLQVLDFIVVKQGHSVPARHLVPALFGIVAILVLLYLGSTSVVAFKKNGRGG